MPKWTKYHELGEKVQFGDFPSKAESNLLSHTIGPTFERNVETFDMSLYVLEIQLAWSGSWIVSSARQSEASVANSCV